MTRCLEIVQRPRLEVVATITAPRHQHGHISRRRTGGRANLLQAISGYRSPHLTLLTSIGQSHSKQYTFARIL